MIVLGRKHLLSYKDFGNDFVTIAVNWIRNGWDGSLFLIVARS